MEKKQELAYRKTANCKINATALTTGICYAIVLTRMEYYECYDALVAAKRLTVGRVTTWTRCRPLRGVKEI